jgi:chaperonin cofactor prefoldin
MSDNWYTEYSQNKRLRGLEDDLSYVSASLASAQSSQRRLRAELSKVQGSIEQRLNRLTLAFDAFVEISDLRVTLGLFDDPGRIRHLARRLLRGEPTTSLVADVEDYWLAPAYVALSVAADGVVDTESLAAAKERDPLRATVFHVLGAGLLGGRETVSVAMLSDALPAFGTSMPGHQRAVWTLAADGFFGESGWELARKRGVEFVAGLADDGPAIDKVRLLGSAAASSEAPPRNFEDVGELSTALQAAARLATLRTWVEKVLAGWTNEPALEVDPAVRRNLELLIEEGSPEELPLLARERELRAVIEATGSEPKNFDSPAGDTLDLLHADLADAEHPGRRALALRSCAAHVLTAAERLAETARHPFPEKVRARTRQGLVTLTASGPESLTALHRRIESTTEVAQSGRVMPVVAAGVGVVFVVLAVISGWGWALAGLAAFGAAAVMWRKDVRTRASAAEEAARAHAALAEEIEQRMATLAQWRSTLVDRQSAIDEDLAAMRAALT